MRKECKRHRWRLGAGIGGLDLKDKKIKVVYTHIWCERCHKSIKAYHDSKTKFKSWTGPKYPNDAFLNEGVKGNGNFRNCN